MVFASLLPPSLSLSFAAGVVALVCWWCVRFPLLALALLYGSLLAGQVARFPLWGQSGGLLLSDLAVLVVLCTAAVHLGHPRQWSSFVRVSLLSVAPFVMWSAWGLALNPLHLSPAEVTVAAAYWARVSCYLLLLPALVMLVRPRARQVYVLVLGTITLLVLAGFLQLWLLPNLAVLEGKWDPHEGRLVTTWLDPNFFGGVLALALPWAVSTLYHQRIFKTHPLVSSAMLVLWAAALVATRSRSSLLALIAGLLIMSPFYVWQLRRSGAQRVLRVAAVLGGVLLIVASGVLVLGERAWGLLFFDPTATARLTALREVWYLAMSHPWVGVGYNAYQFAAQEAGLISDFALHSRAGSDNSLLTLWVTVGLPGVMLFLLPWLTQTYQLLRQGGAARPLAAGLGTMLVVWLVHSQFVNSLLYAHTLIAVVSMVAISQAFASRATAT